MSRQSSSADRNGVRIRRYGPRKMPVHRMVEELLQRLPHRLIRQRERRGQVLREVRLQFFRGQRRSHCMSPSACAFCSRSLNTACACRYSATRSAL